MSGATLSDVQKLHSQCGVYTRVGVVKRILDGIGWTSRSDLSASRLLEPAAGDGQFLVVAADRLVESCRRRGVELRASNLLDRISAFELHPREAERAKARLETAIRAKGINSRTAIACAKAWVWNRDFLIAKDGNGTYTHVAGNPPYVRWSKVPLKLQERYVRHLPDYLIGGDLFVPFLHRSLEALTTGGKIGVICSDRWKFNASAEGFRKEWLPLLDMHDSESLLAADSFETDVDAYPSLLLATKRSERLTQSTRARKGKTLAELGCTIRVGPALSPTKAFVLEPGDTSVEARILKPWIHATDIRKGSIAKSGRRAVAMHDSRGRLRILARFPRLKKKLRQNEKALKNRAKVRNGGRWYAPIDRVRAVDWSRPKILVPELSKVPRCAVDRTGAIPSHSVYAIFVAGDNIDRVYRKLRGGRLAKALRRVSPRVKGGYVRCYARFLSMIRV